MDDKSKSDEELALDVRNGRMEAFDELYVRHYARIRALCRRQIGDPDEAEDLAQEAFVKALVGIERYDPERGPFKPWLYRTAVNCCIDWLRGARPVPVGVLDLGSTEVWLDDAIAIGVKVWQCLDRLEPQDRIILSMKHLAGYTLEEMAEKLGRTVNQVRYSEEKARQQFVECYEAGGGLIADGR